ncbi:MAG: SCO family protein [Bacteroidota bacterium]
MNKKALYGILLAVLLPIAGYFILKGATKNAVTMPRHYGPDSIITQTKNGKEYSDTVWHTLPNVDFLNQSGKAVSFKDLGGRIIVADFFFTHCPTICPGMTVNMKELQRGIKSHEKVGAREANFIQFVSISIDPERDSVAQLKKWADRFQINPQNWWLLTGKRSEIYDLSINHMKLLAQDGGPVDSNFLHTDFFVLIDKYRNIRGYYHGLDTNALSRLSEDIILLALEKDKNKKSFFSGKLELIGIVFLLAALGLLLLFTFLKKENKNK